MKKFITFCLVLLMLISPFSFCFADDSGEDSEKYKKMDQDNDGKLTHEEYEEYRYSQEE